MLHLRGLPLVELDLRDNPIGCQGLIELLSLSRLQTLRIGLTRHSLGLFEGSASQLIAEQTAAYFSSAMTQLKEFEWRLHSDC